MDIDRLAPVHGQWAFYRTTPEGRIMALVPATVQKDGRGLVIYSPSCFRVEDLTEVATRTFPAPLKDLQEFHNTLRNAASDAKESFDLVPWRGKLPAVTIISKYRKRLS